MSKKMQRVFRDRQLNAEEVAADREVRDKVRQEFPPHRTASRLPVSTLSELLKQSIRESGKSVDTLSSEAGVPAVLVKSFLAGERDIHLKTADKLAQSLGLDVKAE